MLWRKQGGGEMRSRWGLGMQLEAGNVGRVVWCEGWLLGMWSVFVSLH